MKIKTHPLTGPSVAPGAPSALALPLQQVELEGGHEPTNTSSVLSVDVQLNEGRQRNGEFHLGGLLSLLVFAGGLGGRAAPKFLTDFKPIGLSAKDFWEFKDGTVSFFHIFVCPWGLPWVHPDSHANGHSIRWAGERKLNLVGNATNLNGIDSDTFSKAVINGLKRWKTASRVLSFDFCGHRQLGVEPAAITTDYQVFILLLTPRTRSASPTFWVSPVYTQKPVRFWKPIFSERSGPSVHAQSARYPGYALPPVRPYMLQAVNPKFFLKM